MSGDNLGHVWPTVVHMLAGAARKRPDHPALVCGDKQLTYGAYYQSVTSLALELAAAGIGAGDRVALLMGNSADIAIAMFAVQAAGAQVVPLNPAYTAAELGPVLVDADVALLIHDAGLEPIFADVLPDATATLCIGDGARDLMVTDRLGATDPGLPDLVLPDPDILSTLQYTGGTTGVAKGVNLSHKAVATNIAQREALLPTGPDERILAITPLFHVYAVSMGLYLAANCAGTLYIMPKFTAAGVLRDIEQHRITFLSASPTIFQALLRDEGFARADLSSLRVCSSGSAALTEDVLHRWEEATGCPVCEGYGQTEAGPVLTYNPLHGRRFAGTVGIAAPHTDISIVDVETGEIELPAGAEGEIRARGPQIMQGYRNQPDETAQALRYGWLYTGDIGRISEAGQLTICDRKKDMVVTSGYNVFPREIEEVLFAMPAIDDAAVVGVADSYRGEMLCAFVVTRKADLTDADIRAHLSTRLAKYKWPRDIYFVTELPKTIVGKTDKKALRKMGSGPLVRRRPVLSDSGAGSTRPCIQKQTEEEKMNKKSIIAASVAMALMAGSATAETVLRVGTFLQPTGTWHRPIERFIEQVNAREGDLRLELVADPSSINPFQLGAAVQSGVIDIAYLSGSFYTNLVPEADALKNFNLSVQEVRENGALELMDKIHREKMGTKFLGKIVDGISLHIYTSRKPESLDMTGFTFRGTPLYRPMLATLGADVAQMPGGEIYGALQSGVIDGYGWPLWGIGDLGLLELTKYRLEPGFFRSEIGLLMNERRWDSLTDAQRTILQEESVAAENWFASYLEEVNALELAKQDAAGIEAVSFDDAESAALIRKADDAAWNEVIRKSPEYGAQLRDLTYQAN